MSSLRVEDTMIELFQPHLSLSESRIERLACAASGMLLAGTAQLPKIARWIRRDTQQGSRLKFLERLLDAPYLNQEQVYQPLLGQALSHYRSEVWHITLGRSTLSSNIEVLAITLTYRKRAIPLVWELVDFGCTSAQEQIRLLQRVFRLIPGSQKVVFHGDTEFGSVEMMRAVQHHAWKFILAQPANIRFRPARGEWQLLSNLPVTQRHPVYVSEVEWIKQHRFGPVNLFAFFDPHQSAPFNPRCDFRYCVTTLPITHTLRRLGHRRWGIEPFFRDYKSSGWEIESSALTHPSCLERLLVLLSVDYLWSTCLGRWLCKTSRRQELDPHPTRHLSLFRIGYDWLIHQFRMERPWPPFLALYA